MSAMTIQAMIAAWLLVSYDWRDVRECEDPAREAALAAALSAGVVPAATPYVVIEVDRDAQTTTYRWFATEAEARAATDAGGPDGVVVRDGALVIARP